MVADPSRGTFAELLLSSRRAAGLTQDAVADLAGLSRQTISRWEAGKDNRPDPKQVRAVCRALGIDPRRAAIALGYIDEETSRADQGLAATIRAARDGKGWTPQDLADRSGVSLDRIIAIEAGTGGHVGPDEVRPIYEALDLPRMQLVAVGYSDAIPDEPPAPTIDDLLRLLEDPKVPNDAKPAIFDYLRYLYGRTVRPHRSASQRFCAAIGKPHPGPLSPGEKAEWQRLQDEVDAQPPGRPGRRDPRRRAA